MIKNKITDSYKLDRYNSLSKIDNDTAEFACKLNVADKMEKWLKKWAYILFKDYKLIFYDKKTMLVNQPIKNWSRYNFNKYYQKYCIEYTKKQ